MPAYLDHGATSPMRPEALSALLPYLTEHFGNPSASHTPGRRALAAVDNARQLVAGHLGAEPGEVVFTGGGTESCNLAVLGAHRSTGGAVVCSAVEHRAVMGPCLSVGANVVGVEPTGLLDLGALAGALHPGVGLVSLMLANNEVGVVQPLARAVALVRELAPRALVHTDAVAAASWLDLAADTADADLVSVAAHKFGGPKGMGALVVRGGARLTPLLLGGAQERERRPGTQDVASIVAMAAALDAAVAGRDKERGRVGALRDALADGLRERVPGTVPSVVPPTASAPGSIEVLPGTLHVRFDAVEQEELLVLLDDQGVYASAGAACASGALEPSHVLLAMGMTPVQARQAVRFTLGWSTSADDVEVAVSAVAKAVEQLRG